MNDTDLLLVNDGTTTSTITLAQYKDGTVLNDTDKFLVNDGTKTETVTWATLKAEGSSPAAPPVLDSVVLTQDDPIDNNRFTGKSFTATTTSSGGSPTSLEMTAKVEGVLGLKAGSSPIETNSYAGAPGTSVELTLEGSTNLESTIVVGDTVTASASYKPTTEEIINSESTDYLGNVIQNTTDPGYFLINPERAFDGNLDTHAVCMAEYNPSFYTFDFSYLPGGGIPYTNRVAIYVQCYLSPLGDSIINDPELQGGSITKIGINGGSKSQINNQNTPSPVILATGSGLLTSIDIESRVTFGQTGAVPNNDGVKVKAIEIDSEILITDQQTLTLADDTDLHLFQQGDEVQPGIFVQGSDVAAKTITVDAGFKVYNFNEDQVWSLGGDTKVSTLTAKKGSGTVSAINGNQVTISPFTDNCFKEGQWLTVNKTPQVSPVSDSISNYDAGTKTITLSGDKDLLQFVNGDDVYMTDAAGTAVEAAITTSEITFVGSANSGIFNPTYHIVQQGGSFDLSSIDDNKLLTFIVIESGDPGIIGVNEPMGDGGDGGAGGDGGNLYQQSMSKAAFVASYGQTYTFDGSHQLGGTLLTDANSGGAGGTASGRGKTGERGGEIPVSVITNLNVTFPEIEFSAGEPGAGGPARDQLGGSRGGGGGGGGGGGLRLNSTNISIPNYPSAGDGTLGQTGPTPEFSAMSGEGGDGWGSGGGGGHGRASGTDTNRPGNPGGGSNGIAILVISDAVADAVLNFDTSANLSSFQDGDVVGDLVTAVSSTSEAANVGDYVSSEGGNYLGLFDPGDGKTYAYFYGYKQATTTWSSSEVDHGASSAVDGESNTNKIGNTVPAIYAVRQSLERGFDDWFVPASDEANVIGLPAYVNDVKFWTSTECGNRDANRYNGTEFGCEARHLSSYDVHALRKKFTSNVPIIDETNLTVGSVENYQVGDTITQAVTGATASIKEINGRVLTVENVSGTFLTNYIITNDSKSVTIGNINVGLRQAEVFGGTYNVGDTVSTMKSGTGTIDSVDFNAKTIVLSASNDQWVNGYHVATASKPAVATTAYLSFNAAGDVTGYSPNPVEPRAMDNLSAPVLNFPDVFLDMGQAPDVEFSDTSSYLQVAIQLKNDAGNSSLIKSNSVIPETVNIRIGPGETANYAEDELLQMLQNIITFEQRVADYSAASRQNNLNRLSNLITDYTNYG